AAPFAMPSWFGGISTAKPLFNQIVRFDSIGWRNSDDGREERSRPSRAKVVGWEFHGCSRGEDSVSD
ncbi:MAG: hypothetical protein O3A60_10630, partial [Planctomycetota bacterium]|nr:hypothetical protein [Planctomycetota bacterium]